MTAIAIEDNPAKRVDVTRRWREESAAVYYDVLRAKLRTRGYQPRVEELTPSSLSGLLRHLRLPKVVNDHGFDRVVKESAESLVTEVGLEETMIRLLGLPTRIPNTVLAALKELEHEERSALLERCMQRPGSPCYHAQLIRICLDLDLYNTRLGSSVHQQLLSLVGKGDSTQTHEAFIAVLRWTHEQIMKSQELLSWSPSVRLAAVWIHAHRLFVLLIEARAPDTWIREFFGTISRRVPTEVFTREPMHWKDVAHPYRIRPEIMRLQCLAYAVGEDAANVLDEPIRDAMRNVMVINDQLKPVFFVDNRLASNSMASFLGRPLALTSRAIINPEYADLLSGEELREAVQLNLARLGTDPNQYRPWVDLMVVLDDFSPYPELSNLLFERMEQTDFSSMCAENPDMGLTALHFASRQAGFSRHKDARNHLIEQLTASATRFSKMCPERKLTLSTDKEWDRRISVFLDACVAACSEHGDAERSASNFAEIMQKVIGAWPRLAAPTRPMIRRFCDELPLSQSEKLMPLMLRLCSLE